MLELFRASGRLYYIPLVDMHKGNGLLDVYLDPLSIVIPVDRSDAINEVAAAYSKLYCNGFIPKIYVKYPIVSYDELNIATDIAERSYVVIDDGSNHSLLKQIREKARVVCNAMGWTYNGQAHQGRYCVQQIVNSPWNAERNIHLISFNDSAMLKISNSNICKWPT